jgi:alpha-N-arabinofuranosidase
MEGLSLHYYTRIGDKVITKMQPDGNEVYWRNESALRGSATEFGEKEWFGILKASWRTDELLTRHSSIMDVYDPEKQVALIVDEWGTWFDNEPGTNPGFLYQQNTLRDALSAAIALNIFNNHAERVRMTNIAQTINVLQAMVLTEGEKMLLTPTYHVFDLFKEHQNGTLLPVKLNVPDYAYNGEALPGLSISASKDKDGKVFITIANPDPVNAVDADIAVRPLSVKNTNGRILSSAAMQDYNTFQDANKVHVEKFTGVELQGGAVKVAIPGKSIVSLSLA